MRCRGIHLIAISQKILNDVYHWNEFEIYLFETVITSPRYQWVKEIKIYLHLPSFYQHRDGTDSWNPSWCKDLVFLHCHCHCCWCPGEASSCSISNGIDLLSNLYYKCTKSKNLEDFWSCLAVVFAQSIEARCWVENEDVVGAAPTGDAPTTSDWSAVLLPAKVHLIHCIRGLTVAV